MAHNLIGRQRPSSIHDLIGGKRDVLRQVFPTHVAASLERGERIQPQSFRDVYVLFADIIEYTAMCKKLPPLSAHKMLEEFYLVLDYCLSLFPRLYKVETIGDCIMVIGGAPIHLCDTTSDVITFAMIIVDVVKRLVLNPVTGEPIGIRVGIHVGDVVGGVFGLSMPRYTFTGDAVNTAARMQSLSETNGVSVSLAVALAVARACALVTSTEATVAADATAASAAAAVTDFVKATIRKLKNVQRGKVEMIPAGTSLPLGGIRLVSRGLESIKGKGLMQTFTLVQDEEQTAFLPRPPSSSSVKATPRTSSFKHSSPAAISHPKVEETAKLLSSPQFKVLCNMSSKELAQNHELSSGGGGQADNQLSSISSRISRILSSASLEALSSKLSLSPEAAVPMEKQQQQQQTQQYSPEGLTPAALSILDGLEILLLSESSTQCKMLCHHLRPINTSWTLRSTTTYEELVGELEVAGFRCDLLLIDSSSLWVASSEKGGADVLTALQQKYPRFMTTVLTVILSEGMSSNSREEEAVRRGVDDCWSKPPEPPVVLQTRLIQAAIAKFLTLSTSSRADSETDSSAVLTNASESDSALSDVVAQLQPRPLNDEQGPNCSDEFFWPADLLEIPANAPPRQQNKKKRMRLKKSLGGDSFSESFKYSRRALSTVGRLLHRGLSNKWSKTSSTEMPLTILVVEDSISQRKLIVRMLQGISANWDVVGCEDDKSAFLELEARNFKVDLIFVDLHLGENSADGNELARSLRTRLSSSAVIIGMNRDRQNTERSFLANGADAAWAKPLPSCDSIGSNLDSLILARTGFAAINEVGGILTDSSSLDSLEYALSAQLKSR